MEPEYPAPAKAPAGAEPCPVRTPRDSNRAGTFASMTSLLRNTFVLAVATAMVIGSGVGLAQAKTPQPKTYAQAQDMVAFTVYAPKTTFGLKRSAFSLNGCGQLNFLNAGYGRQTSSNSTWLSFNQSAKPCTDGPDGVGPAATVKVHGVKAVILGACTGEASTCKKATAAGVKRTAFTEVTLPGFQRTPTYVQLYTQGLSIAQITVFLKDMRAVLDKPGMPKTYAQMQAKAAYTVYQPSQTFGLKRTYWQPGECNSNNPGFHAGYGDQTSSTSASIEFSQSLGPCDDGPDQLAPAGTIDVNGQQVTVLGECPNDNPRCTSATAADVLRTSYLVLTLPAANGHQATSLQLYTQQLTLEQVQEFLVGLTPVG